MRVFAVVASLALCTACVTPPPLRSSDADALGALEAALLALPGEITADDAARLAAGALDATADLHAHYRPLRPPHVGNMAYHMGLRERALCCHWARDLLHALSALDLESVQLHWGVAHYGSALREHSAVVAVPRGGSFEQGLVLDAWRHSGRLLHVRVDRDRYPWVPHPANDVRLRLACRADEARE
ncbi:MAG: hypothetical protein ACQGVC_21095 [Myxococcota bacterium]